MITRKRDVGEKQVRDMGDEEKKTCGVWDFPTMERVGGAIQDSDKNGHEIWKFTQGVHFHWGTKYPDNPD